jgi:hypothetical protein
MPSLRVFVLGHRTVFKMEDRTRDLSHLMVMNAKIVCVHRSVHTLAPLVSPLFTAELSLV